MARWQHYTPIIASKLNVDMSHDGRLVAYYSLFQFVFVAGDIVLVVMVVVIMILAMNTLYIPLVIQVCCFFHSNEQFIRNCRPIRRG